MTNENEFPNLVNLYESDFRQIQHLTISQEIWLGIAIDSAKLVNDSLNHRIQIDKDKLEYIYIGLFNKIKTLFDQLQSFEDNFQNHSFSLLEGIKLLVYESIDFKNNTFPVKQSIISDILDNMPERANNLLFDLVCSFWLLPLTLLDYYYKELSDNNCLPKISELLDAYNPLEGLEEIKSISDQSANARELLIKSNLSYVKWYAFKYRNYGLDYEDVIQEGNIGLIKAVDRFEVRRNIRLKTLAVWWIRQSITRAIADNSRIIRLPVHLSDAFQSLKKEYRKYISTRSEEPSVPVLAELSGLNKERVVELIQWVKPPLPIEKMKSCEENLVKYVNSKHNYRVPVCRDCEKITRIQQDQVKALIIDLEIPVCLDQSLIKPANEKSDRANLLYKVFSDNHNDDPLDHISLKQISKIIAIALDQLNPRERRILAHRYGFKDGDAKTLQEVADKFAVTRERIRQIESVALDRLRQIFEKDPTIQECICSE